MRTLTCDHSCNDSLILDSPSGQSPPIILFLVIPYVPRIDDDVISSACGSCFFLSLTAVLMFSLPSYINSAFGSIP